MKNLSILLCLIACTLILQAQIPDKRIISYLETRHNHTLVNEYNCIGLYQIKWSTLKYIGYSGTIDSFRMDIKLQHHYFDKLVSSHTKTIKSDTAYILPLEDNLVLSHRAGIGRAKTINKLFRKLKYMFMSIEIIYIFDMSLGKYKKELKYLNDYKLYKQFI